MDAQVSYAQAILSYRPCAASLPNVGSKAVSTFARSKSFSVTSSAGQAQVSWQLAWHPGATGFHVFRQESDASRIRLTPAILTGEMRYEFIDPRPPSQEATYWLQGVARDGTTTWLTSARLAPLVQPVPGLSLAPAHPNPFNPQTTLSYFLPEAGLVSLGIYNLQGQLVLRLIDRTEGAGAHAISWQGNDRHGKSVPSGTYLARLEANGKVCAQKMLLAR